MGPLPNGHENGLNHLQVLGCMGLVYPPTRCSRGKLDKVVGASHFLRDSSHILQIVIKPPSQKADNQFEVFLLEGRQNLT